MTVLVCKSAIDGGAPLFDEPLPVGQLYFPEWERYEAAMRGIFEREYYNNNGPLVSELEEKLRKFFGVKHAICTGNATFALMMVADALELVGSVIMPSFTFIASAQSLDWCGLKPRFCDIDPNSHQLDPEQVEAILKVDKSISAIMGVNLWGGACAAKALEEIADRYSIPIYFDSAHAFGCKIDSVPIGQFGRAEVFSFHATKVLSAGEGGCITTNDDKLAAKLCAIRPSYGNYQGTDIVRVINSRMSEAQAAIGLMSLEDYPRIKDRNRSIFEKYEAGLCTVPGIRLMRPHNVSDSNYQYAILEVDAGHFGLTRDQLVRLLRNENILARRYFYPATHRSAGFDLQSEMEGARLPVTERVCQQCMQLPLGSRLDLEKVQDICNWLIKVQQRAPRIRETLAR